MHMTILLYYNHDYIRKIDVGNLKKPKIFFFFQGKPGGLSLASKPGSTSVFSSSAHALQSTQPFTLPTSLGMKIVYVFLL